MGVAVRVLAALGALLVCGCTVNVPPKASEPSPSASEAGPVSGPVERNPVIDRVFLTTLRSEYPEAFVGPSGRLLIKAGHELCDAMAGGASFQDVAGATMDAGYTAGQSGYFVGAAITAYCPEYDYTFG